MRRGKCFHRCLATWEGGAGGTSSPSPVWAGPVWWGGQGGGGVHPVQVMSGQVLSRVEREVERGGGGYPNQATLSPIGLVCSWVGRGMDGYPNQEALPYLHPSVLCPAKIRTEGRNRNCFVMLMRGCLVFPNSGLRKCTMLRIASVSIQ